MLMALEVVVAHLEAPVLEQLNAACMAAFFGTQAMQSQLSLAKERYGYENFRELEDHNADCSDEEDMFSTEEFPLLENCFAYFPPFHNMRRHATEATKLRCAIRISVTNVLSEPERVLDGYIDELWELLHECFPGSFD